MLTMRISANAARISAVQLSRILDICYDSAWHLLDRIRIAMGKRDENYKLSGIVELDDGYVGGNSHNGKRGRGTDKPKIVVALSKSSNGAALYARMRVVDNIQGATLQQIVDKYFAPDKQRNNTAALHELKSHAMQLADDGFDENWLFVYEALPKEQLHNDWKPMKAAGISFVKQEYR